MKNEKYKKLYFALHNAELRLSVAMRRVQIVQEWIDEREEKDYLDELNNYEVMDEIYKAIFKTLDAKYDLWDALKQIRQVEEKHHD